MDKAHKTPNIGDLGSVAKLHSNIMPFEEFDSWVNFRNFIEYLYL